MRDLLHFTGLLLIIGIFFVGCDTLVDNEDSVLAKGKGKGQSQTAVVVSTGAATMFAGINGGQQGFYETGSSVADPPDIFPAGRSFTVADYSDLRLFIGTGDVSGEVNISNLTVSCVLADPQTKDDCKNGGWEKYGFRNQGLCIQFVNTSKDSRDPININYGNFTVTTPWWNTSFPERWDLSKCIELTVSYELDMSQMGAGWVPIQVGLKEPGAGNIDPNYSAGWLQAFPALAANTDPDNLDNDDKFVLVNHGWLTNEKHYNVLPDGSIGSPFGTSRSAGIWYDRDGVDQWQAQQWDMSQNGTAYNTGGMYDIVITYRYIPN